MVNYFRRFIPNFAEITIPLNGLRKKGVPFQWGYDQQYAFDTLKSAIIMPPVLAVPDFSRPFVLQTDASGAAVAAVLLQEYPEGRKAVAYASRGLSQTEKNYSVYELEALAVLFGLEKFRLYLEHREFTIETDNKALSWVLSRPRKTGRLARWAVRISSFKFVVKHIRGSDNCVADALSRMFYDDDTNSGPVQETPVVVANAILADCPLAFTNIRSAQDTDQKLAPIIQSLESGQLVKPYVMKGGVLCCKARCDNKLKVVIPDSLVPMIFHYFHVTPFGGHLGIFKTLAKIREQFIWLGMDQDVQARVKSCFQCNISKPSQAHRFGYLSSTIAEQPMDKLFIDYIGKLPRSSSGNTYLLVCVDAFTKFVWLFPVREATSQKTIQCLKSIISSFGVPRCIVSDNASQFVSRQFTQFCFVSGITHTTTVPYYPNPSQAERVNRNIKSALIAYHHQNHTKWDSNLSWLQFAFNSAVHESTKTTPFALLLNYKPNCPLSNLWALKDLLPDNPSTQSIRDVWNRVRRNLSRAHAHQKRNYDKLRLPNPFKTGDQVFLVNHPLSKAVNKFSAKLAPRFQGPYVIDSWSSPVTVSLKDATGKLIRAHISQLKLVTVKP